METPNYKAAWINLDKLDVDFPTIGGEDIFDEQWWRQRGYKPLKEVSKVQLVAIINQLQDFRDPALEEAVKWQTVPTEQLPLSKEEEVHNNNNVLDLINYDDWGMVDSTSKWVSDSFVQPVSDEREP